MWIYLMKTIMALSNETTIVALKDATGDLSRVPVLSQASLTLLGGDDASAAKFVLAGGHGAISVASNIVPASFSELMRLSLRRDQGVLELGATLGAYSV